ncbi:MAG: STAS domain-containing protein [Acidimicrobiia bacterium]|nr:STAS domain-containing protein [Acidimicrobiia bacterium]
MSMDLVTRLHGGVGHLQVIGEIDTLTAPELRAAGARLFEDGARALLVDCAGIAFIDSAGLSVLLELHDQAELRFATMTLCEPTEQTRRLLAITGLDAKLMVAPPVPARTA